MGVPDATVGDATVGATVGDATVGATVGGGFVCATGSAKVGVGSGTEGALAGGCATGEGIGAQAATQAVARMSKRICLYRSVIVSLSEESLLKTKITLRTVHR